MYSHITLKYYITLRVFSQIVGIKKELLIIKRLLFLFPFHAEVSALFLVDHLAQYPHQYKPYRHVTENYYIGSFVAYQSRVDYRQHYHLRQEANVQDNIKCKYNLCAQRIMNDSSFIFGVLIPRHFSGRDKKPAVKEAF